MRRVAVVLAMLAAVLAAGDDVVRADAPVKQGWWSKWQQDAATSSTVPSGLPATPPSVTVPGPPTGDDGGLTVAHGPTGPEAVAAMYFQVEAPVDGSLYLTAAPRKKAGTPEPTTSTSVAPPKDPPHPDAIVLPPGAVVLACPALSAWERESNAPWSRVPTWGTDNCVPGTVTASGTAMFWNLSASMQDGDDNYDVVLVPMGPPPAPPGAPAPPASTSYMVNFAAPGADTLVTEDIEDLPPEPDPETEPDPEDEPIPAVDDATGIDAPPTGGFTTPTATPRSPSTSLLASGRLSPRRLPFSFPDTRAERVMAVMILLAMAGALWWVGGSPTRLPRLIGAVAGRSPTATVVPPDRLRGVGRFARLRSGRVPRL